MNACLEVGREFSGDDLIVPECSLEISRLAERYLHAPYGLGFAVNGGVLVSL